MLSLRNARLTLKVLRGAVLGGITTGGACFVLLAVYGMLTGAGLVYAIYFAGLVIIYALPIGILIGAIVVTVRNLHAVLRHDQPEDGEDVSPLAYVLWMGIPLLLIAAMVIIPLRMVGEKRIVTHGATWTTDTELHPECAVPVVILKTVAYGEYNVVCSPQLLSRLQEQGEDIVPIEYRVTYDFGKARSYELVRADGIEIDGGWLDSPSGCDVQYTPPCHRSHVNDGLRLYTSSWTGKEN